MAVNCTELRARYPMVFRYLQMFCCEFFGTFILVFIGCMGCVTHISGVVKTHMEVSAGFGYAILMGVHIFGPISGAHLNPAVSIAALVLRYKSIKEMASYIVAQILGGVAAYAILVAVTPYELVRLQFPNICVASINPDVGLVRAFVVEFISTFILTLVCASAWDNDRNSNKTDSLAIRLGLVIAGLILATGPYTTAQMNPARSFGPAIISWQWTDHWLFWIAPISGGIMAAVLYRYVFGFIAEELPSSAINPEN